MRSEVRSIAGVCRDIVAAAGRGAGANPAAARRRTGVATGTDLSAKAAGSAVRRPGSGSTRATTPTMSIRATFPAATPCATAPPL